MVPTPWFCSPIELLWCVCSREDPYVSHPAIWAHMAGFLSGFHEAFWSPSQTAQYPLIMEYTFNHNIEALEFKVYSLIKGSWALWEQKARMGVRLLA